MNTRLEQFLAAENISQSSLADTLGVARASISHIIAGRNKPGYEFLTNLMRSYPALNIEWLLLGKGKMYKNPSQNQTSPVPEKENRQIIDSQEGVSDDQQAQPSLFEEPEPKREVVENKPLKQNTPPPASAPEKQIKKVIILYSDGSFTELV